MNWAGDDDLLAGLVAGLTEVGPQHLLEGFRGLFHIPDLELDFLDVFTVCLHGAIEGSHGRLHHLDGVLVLVLAHNSLRSYGRYG